GRPPFGLGTHPYFRLPLGPKGTAKECRMTVPVTEYWPMEGMLPMSRRAAATGSRDLASGMTFANTHFDDVFSGIKFQNHKATATIADPHNGRTLSMIFDDAFTQCVVYNPPHREAICIEPYSC